MSAGPAAGVRQAGVPQGPRLPGADPARRRARAAPARVRDQAARLGEALPAGRRRGRRDGRDARAGGVAGAAAGGARRPRSTSRASCTRCCATSARSPASAAPGSTRSSGRRGWGRFARAPTSTARRSSACTRALHVLGDAIDHYEEVIGETVPDKLPMPLQRPPPRGRAVPALRDDDRGRLLRRAPDELLPDLPDRREGAQGPPPLAAAEVSAPVARLADRRDSAEGRKRERGGDCEDLLPGRARVARRRARGPSAARSRGRR